MPTHEPSLDPESAQACEPSVAPELMRPPEVFVETEPVRSPEASVAPEFMPSESVRYREDDAALAEAVVRYHALGPLLDPHLSRAGRSVPVSRRLRSERITFQSLYSRLHCMNRPIQRPGTCISYRPWRGFRAT